MPHRKGHKKSFSVKVSTKKSRQKRRDIRARAEARGKPITLQESKDRALGIEKKVEPTEIPTRIPEKEDVIELGGRGEPPISRAKGIAKIVGAGVGIASLAIPGTAAVRGGLLAFKAARTAKGIKVSADTILKVRQSLALRNFATGGGKGVTAITKVPGKEVLFRGKNAAILNAYRTNPKTSSLTTKILITAGMSLGVASIAKDIIGTYPFASFAREETLQAISFPMNRALEAGLYEEAAEMLALSEEIIDNLPSNIPYKNVLQEFKKYEEAQRAANKVWAKIIEKKIAEISGEAETEFAQQRRESDEASTKRKLVQQDLDSQYFGLIREGKFEEAEELLQSRLKEAEGL